MTRDLERRIHEHRHPTGDCFTARYRIYRLVYFETAPNPRAAIAREKVIKKLPRQRKIALIERENPGWEDLAATWR